MTCYRLQVVGYGPKLSVFLMGTALLAVCGCCTRPPDQAVFLNKDAEKALEEAENYAQVGKLAEARSLCADARARLEKARQVARSPYNRRRAATLLDAVRRLEQKIAEVEGQAAITSVAATATSRKPATAEDWFAATKPTTATTATTAETGQPAAAVDIAGQERAAMQSRHGARGVAREDVEKFDPLAGQKTESVMVVKQPVTSGEPVFVRGIEKKGKNVLVRAVFNNPGPPAVVIQLTAELCGAGGASFDTAYTAYLESGFQPNWQDIFESRGTPVTGDVVKVPQNGALPFVVVTTSEWAGDVQRAIVEVRLEDGRAYTGRGPK